MSEPHVIVIESIDDDGYPKYDIECPGLTAGGCVCYWECQEPACDPDDDGMAHGVEHRSMHYGWGVESSDCWVQQYEEFHDEMVEAFADAKREMVPGRYPFEHESEDEYMNISLLTEPHETDTP